MIILDFARKDTLIAVARERLKELQKENDEANHDLITNIQTHMKAVEEDWSELSFVILNNLVGAFKLKKIDLSVVFSNELSVMWDVLGEIAKNTDEIDEIRVECYDQTAYRVDIRRLVEVLQIFKKIDRLVIKVVKQTAYWLNLLDELPVRSLSLTIETERLLKFEVSSFIKNAVYVEELFIKLPEMKESTSALVEAIQANKTLKVGFIRCKRLLNPLILP